MSFLILAFSGCDSREIGDNWNVSTGEATKSKIASDDGSVRTDGAWQTVEPIQEVAWNDVALLINRGGDMEWEID